MKTTERKKATRTREIKPGQPREKVSAGKGLGSVLSQSSPDLFFVASGQSIVTPVTMEAVRGGKAEEEHAAAEFERTLALIEESRQRAQRTQEDIDRLKRQTRAILDKLLINL